MARVSIEKQAISDPRFTVLGSHLDPLRTATPQEINSAFGLYLAIRVYDYCSDRGLLVVHRRDLEAIRPGLAAAMLDAELAEVVEKTAGKKLRIRGGAGRLDWSDRARRNGALGASHGEKGAEFGKLGGRPKSDRTPHTGVSETPLRGDTKTPPHAHAHAQALSDSEVSPKASNRVESGVRRDASHATPKPPPDLGHPILTFPVQGKERQWFLTQEQVDEWKGLYPMLDVMQECRKALAYFKAKGLKTHRGMPAALVGWLNRQVDYQARDAAAAKRDGAYREPEGQRKTPDPAMDAYAKRWHEIDKEERASGKHKNDGEVRSAITRRLQAEREAGARWSQVTVPITDTAANPRAAVEA
jgi:hypothetical protein